MMNFYLLNTDVTVNCFEKIERAVVKLYVSNSNFRVVMVGCFISPLSPAHLQTFRAPFEE